MEGTGGAKLSIIIPVYKVEPYLRRCLDSVTGQSYRKLEAILVDDGSPDNCGAICDEYAARDKRIKVIHRENGGVASARNAGLEAATGAYIGWVDPDDWIEPDMYEYMLENLLRHRADMAVCGMQVIDAGTEEANWLKKADRVQVLDREQAMERYLKREMHDGCVNKLSRRELWEGLRFPEYRMAEDLAVTWRLFERAAVTVRLPEEKYVYYRRGDSITKAGDFETGLDDYWAIKARYDEMMGSWPQFEELLARRCLESAREVRRLSWSASRSARRAAKDEMAEMSAFCRRYVHNAMEWYRPGLAGKIQLYLLGYPQRWSLTLERLVEGLYQMRHDRKDRERET